MNINKKNFINKIIDKDIKYKKNFFVNTRFPPEPNGYLHIGHVKSIYLNFNLAKQYSGICNLRFDDTNPSTEQQKFIDSIQKDILWLGFIWDNINYTSQYFDKIYGYAIELINKGLAYIDHLTAEEICQYRGTLTKPGINSPYRNRSIKDNIKFFQQMKEGYFNEQTVCLRAKINMSSPFIILRDPVLYRVKFKKHHQTGNKWCIYPLYDFSHCISDSLEKITYSLCTMEFQDNRRLYEWILNNISINHIPIQYEFSRVNIERTILSKRKLNILIKNNIVSGWDDPRMPTISGLKRRGYTANSIIKFCELIGVTKQNNLIEMQVLENCIRNDLNKTAPRALAVLDPIKIIIENMDIKTKILMIPNHPKNKNMGNRLVPFNKEIYIDRSDFIEYANKNFKRLTLYQSVKLRYSYIINVNRVLKDINGNINIIYCSYDPYSLHNNIKNQKIGIIHWVSAIYNLPAEMHLYNYLFDNLQPNINNNILSQINKDSLVIKKGFVESNLINAKPGNMYQFEREGYFCVDKKSLLSKSLIFNRTVTLRNIKSHN